MLIDSCGILGVTMVLGLVLVGLHAMRRGAALRLIGPLHGMLGALGLSLLLVALRGPARGVATGVGSFGVISAVLLGLALAAGLLVLATSRRRRDPMLAIGLHATLAIFGIVLLAAYATAPA